MNIGDSLNVAHFESNTYRVHTKLHVFRSKSYTHHFELKKHNQIHTKTIYTKLEIYETVYGHYF